MKTITTALTTLVLALAGCGGDEETTSVPEGQGDQSGAGAETESR